MQISIHPNSVRTISLILLLNISFVFGLKYIVRDDIVLSGIISLGWQLLIFIFYKILYKYPIKTSIKQEYILFLSLSLVLMYYILLPKPELLQIHVDRWSAIVYWWDGVFKGVYPYFTRTHHGGFHAPSPVLELVYFPGYIWGDIGIINLLLSLIFIYYICKNQNLINSTFILAVYLGSFAFYWETYVRSTLIGNSILVILAFELWDKKIKKIKYSYLILGFFAGCLLATRASTLLAILPFSLYVTFWNNFQIKNLVLFGISTVFAFVMAFLPLVWVWGWDSFVAANPINHQQQLIPFWFTIVILIASVFISKSNDLKTLYLLIGILFFISGISFEIFAILKEGWECAWYRACGDISYINSSIPFLIIGLINES
jgi:hypothetical protein